MMFNDLVNASIVICGLLDFLGVFGGICFLIWYCYQRMRPKPVPEEGHSCGNCQSYEACNMVMDGCLPDFPCAYWQNKKL